MTMKTEAYYSELTPLVEVVENNSNCVVLKVKPYMQTALVATGYFSGTEQQFRLTRYSRIDEYRREASSNFICLGKDLAELTIWYSGGITETRTLDPYKASGNKLADACILRCVCVDLGIPLFFDRTMVSDTAVAAWSEISTVRDKYLPGSKVELHYDRDLHAFTCNDIILARAVTSHCDRVYLSHKLIRALPALDPRLLSTFADECLCTLDQSSHSFRCWKYLSDMVTPQSLAAYDLLIAPKNIRTVKVEGYLYVDIAKDSQSEQFEITVRSAQPDRHPFTSSITVPWSTFGNAPNDNLGVVALSTDYIKDYLEVSGDA